MPTIRIELILFIVFCLLLIFQIFNLIRVKKELKAESAKLSKVKAKVVKCKLYSTVHKDTEDKNEDVELTNDDKVVGMQDMQYGVFEYEYEGKTYTSTKLIPYTQIGMYQPGTEVEIAITKENPETVVLERFDSKLESDMVRNIVFLVVSILFVGVLGLASFADSVVPMEDRVGF